MIFYGKRREVDGVRTVPMVLRNSARAFLLTLDRIDLAMLKCECSTVSNEKVVVWWYLPWKKRWT